MAKKQVNFRANEKTLDQIDEMTKRYNMTQAELIAFAVDMYYRHEMDKFQYVIFIHSQMDKNGNRYRIACVTDELAYQKSIEGKPRHDWPGKPHRSDFIIWEGKPESIPAHYLAHSKNPNVNQ